MLKSSATNTLALVYMNAYIVILLVLCILGIIALIKIIKVCNIYIKEHNSKE